MNENTTEPDAGDVCMCGESEVTHGWGDPPHMFHPQGEPDAGDIEVLACACPTDDYCPKCHPRWHAKWLAREEASR